MASISVCGVNSVETNAVIKTKIQAKKLRFGETKCHQLHIGGNKTLCPNLTVNKDDKVEKINEDKYLGGVVSDVASNEKKIDYARNKGTATISSIMAILKEVSLGHHYLEIAMLLRETLFVNVILWNIETWYNLTTKEIEQLEIIDTMLLKRILEVPTSTPSALLYLELGITPLPYIIQAKRIMFLKYILSRPKDDLLRKFFDAQCKKPSKNDWCITVQQDLDDLEIDEDFESIANIKKEKLSSIVKKAYKQKAFEDLLALQEQYSKGSQLLYGQLAMREYLKSQNLNINQKKLIFKLRTRMFQVKSNFKNNNMKNMKCPCCNIEVDDQIHLIKCEKLDAAKVDNSEYFTLFGNNDEKMSKMIQKLEKITKQRNIILEDKNNVHHNQVDNLGPRAPYCVSVPLYIN